MMVKGTAISSKTSPRASQKDNFVQTLIQYLFEKKQRKKTTVHGKCQRRDRKLALTNFDKINKPKNHIDDFVDIKNVKDSKLTARAKKETH